MIEGSAPDILKNVLERAKTGDGPAQAIFFKYLMPRVRLSYIATPFDLSPALDTVDGIKAEIVAMVRHYAAGEIAVRLSPLQRGSNLSTSRPSRPLWRLSREISGKALVHDSAEPRQLAGHSPPPSPAAATRWLTK
jgi:hypothetical protein